MDLRAYLTVLWRRRWVILITLMVTTLVTTAGVYFATPSYVASATVRVATASSGSADWINYDVAYTDRLMNTYRTIVTSQRTAEEVKQRLGLAEPPAISVDIPANTELMEIHVSHSDPLIAAEAANTVATMLVTQVQERVIGPDRTAQQILGPQLAQLEAELRESRASLDRRLAEQPADSPEVIAARESLEIKEQTYLTLLEQYERMRITDMVRSNHVAIVQTAVPPTDPSSPGLPMILALALMVGMAGGVGLAFLFENLDTTLYSLSDIQETSALPVVGRIPLSRDGDREFFLPGSSQHEAFRRLRTNLLALDQELPLRTVLVTSAERGEGKSTVAANLAMAIAQAGRSVVIVDADLREPSMHQRFELDNQTGLLNILAGQATYDDATQATRVPGLSVLTSGAAPSRRVSGNGYSGVPANPVELLGLSQMAALMAKLERLYDIVVIDSPSVLSGADAAVIATHVDGVLMVVAQGKARREQLTSALQQLLSVRANALGVVVNRSDETPHAPYGPRDGQGDEVLEQRSATVRSSLRNSRPSAPLPAGDGARAFPRRIAHHAEQVVYLRPLTSLSGWAPGAPQPMAFDGAAARDIEGQPMTRPATMPMEFARPIHQLPQAPDQLIADEIRAESDAEERPADWRGARLEDRNGRASWLPHYTKRLLDVAAASVLLVILAPLMLLIALAIRLDSPGPVLFRQQRVGARRRREAGLTYWEVQPFTILKFRSMTRDADASIHQAHISAFVEGRLNGRSEEGTDVKLANDSRITRVGGLLRKTSLDELPQLINVIRGEMSLVGPRPVPDYEVAHYSSWHLERLASLPGITGLWQVYGRGRVTFDEQVRMDIHYVRHRTVWLDMKLLLLTLPAVVAGKGAR